MAILSSSAYPVLSSEVAKNRDAEIGARFVTLKASLVAKRLGKAVEIPALDLQATMSKAASSPKFSAMLVGLLEKYQGEIVQGMLSKDSTTTIYAQNISIDALIVAYESSLLSEGRISKDKITAWFDSALVTSLTVRFADKLGISNNPSEQESKKISMVISAYRDNFGRLAMREVGLADSVKNNLKLALELADESSMKTRLADIIAESTNPEELLGL